MENSNNKIWIWVIVVALIAVVLFLVFYNNQAVVPPTTENSQIPTTTGTESSQDVSGITGVGAVSISYTNALIKYADRRIQLDETCQAHPNNVTYKDNTGIMIDNRSPQTRTIKVGTTFTIKPYGFKIVILPDIYLKAKTLLVDCDKYQNVATVLVQE
jgi:hypothetical protein